LCESKQLTVDEQTANTRHSVVHCNTTAQILMKILLKLNYYDSSENEGSVVWLLEVNHRKKVVGQLRMQNFVNEGHSL